MQPRLIIVLTIGWLALRASGFAQPGSSAVQQQRLYLLGTASKDDLRREVFSLSPALVQGDYSAIDAAAARGDLNFLWFVFNRACFKDIGYDAILQKFPDEEEASAQKALANQKIVDYVRPIIADVPGHAKILGDRVEAISSEKGHFFAREGLLGSLGRLGSMEAIQQIGRFVGDMRNPDAGFYEMDSGMRNTRANWWEAASAMHKALESASPAQPISGVFQPSDARKIREWWQSDASKPYREWTYETGLPLPPPRPRPVAAATQPNPPAPTAPKPSAPATVEANSHVNLWVVGLGAGLAIAIVAWVAWRRGRKI